MSQVKTGDTVHIHYTGRLNDGTVFDTSEDREPLSFELGEGTVIPGFEEAVTGMEPGDKKTTKITAEEAYGARREDMVVTVAREHLPEGVEPKVGEVLQMSSGDDQTFNVVVSEIGEDSIVLDANHPLAGEDLTFEIELVKVA